MDRVEKPWGYELIWAKTNRYIGKILFIRAGHALSLQYHKVKDETVCLQAGRMLWESADLPAGFDEPIGKQVGRDTAESLHLSTRELAPGEAVRVRPHTVHRMTAIEDCTVLEVSTPDPDDVVRVEDRYGREGTSEP